MTSKAFYTMLYRCRSAELLQWRVGVLCRLRFMPSASPAAAAAAICNCRHLHLHLLSISVSNSRFLVVCSSLLFRPQPCCHATMQPCRCLQLCLPSFAAMLPCSLLQPCCHAVFCGCCHAGVCSTAAVCNRVVMQPSAAMLLSAAMVCAVVQS